MNDEQTINSQGLFFFLDTPNLHQAEFAVAWNLRVRRALFHRKHSPKLAVEPFEDFSRHSLDSA